jgi:hypothetical protein
MNEANVMNPTRRFGKRRARAFEDFLSLSSVFFANPSLALNPH